MVLDAEHNETDWSPERKIMGAAVSVLLAFGLQVFTDLTVPPGVEGALAVVVGYFIPNKR